MIKIAWAVRSLSENRFFTHTNSLKHIRKAYMCNTCVQNHTNLHEHVHTFTHEHTLHSVLRLSVQLWGGRHEFWQTGRRDWVSSPNIKTPHTVCLFKSEGCEIYYMPAHQWMVLLNIECSWHWGWHWLKGPWPLNSHISELSCSL